MNSLRSNMSRFRMVRMCMSHGQKIHGISVYVLMVFMFVSSI